MIEKLNATICQLWQNVSAETLVTLLSTPKTVILSRKHCRRWEFVLGRLFSLVGWILNTLSCNAFSEPFFSKFFSAMILNDDRLKKRTKNLRGIMKGVPRHRSEDQERKFWSKANSTDYIDWKWAKRVTFLKLKPSLRTIFLRLPEMMIEELKLLKNTGIRPTLFIIIWFTHGFLNFLEGQQAIDPA